LQKPTGEKRGDLLKRIQQTIEPVNVTGLGIPEKHNWYAADAEDLLASTEKLQASREEIEAMLKRCGLTASVA
jgi:hypothetical protein